MINTFYSSFYWPEQVSSNWAYLLWRQVKVRVLRRDAVGLNGVLIQPSHIHQKGIFHEKYKCNFMKAKIQSMAGVEHVCSSYYNNSTKVHLSENEYKSYRENNDLIWSKDLGKELVYFYLTECRCPSLPLSSPLLTNVSSGSDWPVSVGLHFGLSVPLAG